MKSKFTIILISLLLISQLGCTKDNKINLETQLKIIEQYKDEKKHKKVLYEYNNLIKIFGSYNEDRTINYHYEIAKYFYFGEDINLRMEYGKTYLEYINKAIEDGFEFAIIDLASTYQDISEYDKAIELLNNIDIETTKNDLEIYFVYLDIYKGKKDEEQIIKYMDLYFNLLLDRLENDFSNEKLLRSLLFKGPEYLESYELHTIMIGNDSYKDLKKQLMDRLEKIAKRHSGT